VAPNVNTREAIVADSFSETGERWRISDGDARWVFPSQPNGAVNQYVDFLHRFEGDATGCESELLISADTDFAVWLNGQLIGHGQYSNHPDRKTYERFDVGDTLRQGRNTLAVTVFYNGRTSSVYERGEPGLLYEVRGQGVLAASGTDTLCRANPCYHSGPIAIVSGQLAYTFGYDARGADGFEQDGYTPGEIHRLATEATGNAWRAIGEDEARAPAGREELLPRPVPRLVGGGHTAARLVASGVFRRDVSFAEAEFEGKAVGDTAAGLVLDKGGAAAGSQSPTGASPVVTKEQVTASPGWLMQRDVLSERQMPDMGRLVSVDDLGGHDGIYLVFDMGQEEAGHVQLDIEAPDGTMLDMGYGEHLDDGRVRSFVGGRSFGARYICREGRQQFTHHFLRWAGRYLQIHVHAGAFTLHGLALERREYPLEYRGTLSTGKALHDRLLSVGRRTLHLCMHEHYEDTPWREQALYANDARTQALCGYYAFGETAMPAASFTLLGQSLRNDGFLMLTAPGAPGLTIPSFTFAWMLAVRDHYLYSGDDSLARAFLPQILSMLRAFLAERKAGLLPLRQQRGVWHFYDWSAGMSGYSKEDLERGLDADAPLNCFFILALEAAQQMLGWCGEGEDEGLAEAINEIRQAVGERFWDPSESVFRTHEQTETLTQLTQALAVLAGAGDAQMRARALDRMARADSDLAEPGLSQSFYTFEALMTRKEKYGAGVLAGIEATWGKMLDAGATTFWETIKGASDFSNAGSLCHGWSAVPVYVLYHNLLGVRPLTPGFRTFAVDPMTDVIESCSGQVPVPGGEIKVSWDDVDGEARVKVDTPENLQLETSLLFHDFVKEQE